MTDDEPQPSWGAVRRAMGGPTEPTSPWGRVAADLAGSSRSASGGPATEARAPTGSAAAEASPGDPAVEEAAPPDPVVTGAPTGRRRRLVAIPAVAVVAALVAVGLLVWPGLAGGLPDGVALRVYGHNVTEAQVASTVKVLEGYYGYQSPPASNAKARREFLADAARAYAIDEIVTRQATAMHVTLSASQAVGGLTDSQIQAVATNRGVTTDQVRDQLRLAALETQLVARVGGSVNPTDAQTNQVFAANRSALAVPETRTIDRILVGDLTTARQILAALAGGQSFAALAAQSSLDAATKTTGGLLGTVPRAAVSSPNFAQAAFAANVNQPFGPVSEGQSGGYDVGLVTAVNPAGPAVLDARTTGVIAQWLTAKSRSGRWATWLRAQIVAAHIRYRASYQPASPLTPPPLPVPSLASLMASAVSQIPTSGGGS